MHSGSIFLLLLFAFGNVLSAPTTDTETDQSGSVGCQKMTECNQIFLDQTKECRRLVDSFRSAAASGQQPKQCEITLKDKQKQFLELTQTIGEQTKTCLANRRTRSPVVRRGANRKHNKGRGGNKNCANLETSRLRPVKTFPADTTGSDGKQEMRKIKQCFAMLQTVRNQCRPVQKCCSNAKKCHDQMKTSPLHNQLKQIQRDLHSAKKSCKPQGAGGGGHKHNREENESEDDEESKRRRRML